MVRSVPTLVDRKDRSVASFSPLFGTLEELCPCGCGGRAFRWAEGASLAVCFQTLSGVRELIQRVPLAAAQKHLLQVFLNHTRDKRECWPSESRLLQCTGLKSRQTLLTHKKALRAVGILDWERPRQRGNPRACLLYRLSWEALQELVVACLREPPGCSWPAASAAPQAQPRAAGCAPQDQPGPGAPRARVDAPWAQADASQADASRAPAPQAAPWAPPAESRAALPRPPVPQVDATPTVAGMLATVLTRLAAARGQASATPLPPASLDARNEDLEFVLDEAFFQPPATEPATPSRLPAVEIVGAPVSAVGLVGSTPEPEATETPEPVVAETPAPAAVEPPEPEAIEMTAHVAAETTKPSAAQGPRRPSFPGEPAAVPVASRRATVESTEALAAAPLALAASRPCHQQPGVACVVSVALVWDLWRDAYQRAYGRPYAQTTADRAAAGEIAEACAAAVLHHERRAGLAPGEREQQAQAYLRHVFQAFLRRAGRNDFLRERKHPLSQLPADLNALGEPWPKEPKAAPAPAAPLPPPLPREEQLARCRGVLQALDGARAPVRPRIARRG